MKLAWKYTTGNSVNFIVAIEKSNSVIFCADQDVYCIDNSRNVKWKYEAGSFINHFEVSSDGANVFISTDEEIISLSKIGHLNWKIQTSVPTSCIKLTHNQDKIIIGYKDGKIICINLSGDEVWTNETGAAIQKIVTGKDIISLSKGGSIIISGQDGKTKSNISDAGIIDIQLLNDDLYTCSKDGIIEKIVDGKPSWKRKLKSEPITTIACKEAKCVVIGCNDGSLFSFTPDGKVKNCSIDSGCF